MYVQCRIVENMNRQARRQLNWNGGGGMDSQYKLLSELLSDQAAFITSPKTSLANYWGVLPPLPPSVYGPGIDEGWVRSSNVRIVEQRLSKNMNTVIGYESRIQACMQNIPKKNRLTNYFHS